MESSLQLWLEEVCRKVLEICDEVLFDQIRSIVILTQNIFALDDEPSLMEVAELLQVQTLKDNEINCIKKLLKLSISPVCSMRESFVAHILSMEGEVQNNLMFAIQDNDEVDLESTDMNKEFDNVSSKQPLEVYTCENCIMKDNDIEHYTREINAILE